MGQSMIDKYGRVRVRKIVADFYDSVLNSRRLAPYFDNVDIQGLVSHQSAFLGAVMGGPASHSTTEITRAHRGLGISEEDFREMIELLEATLQKFEVDESDVEAVTDRYQALEHAVIEEDSFN